MYAGYLARPIEPNAYMALVAGPGFTGITVQKEKAIHIPDDILGAYFTPAEIKAYNSEAQGIFSITVYAQKPAGCCAPGCCNHPCLFFLYEKDTGLMYRQQLREPDS